MEEQREPNPTAATRSPVDELRSLPSFEATKSQVQAAVAEIITEARKVVPSITWQTLDEGARDQCEQPFENTAGQRYFFPDHVAESATASEGDWAKILQVAKDSAAKIGATNVRVMHDQPGNHDVWFSGPTGLFIKVGYQGNLVVSGYTGCRLP